MQAGARTGRGHQLQVRPECTPWHGGWWLTDGRNLTQLEGKRSTKYGLHAAARETQREGREEGAHR
jgi:hypothetical protein